MPLTSIQHYFAVHWKSNQGYSSSPLIYILYLSRCNHKMAAYSNSPLHLSANQMHQSKNLHCSQWRLTTSSWAHGSLRSMETRGISFHCVCVINPVGSEIEGTQVVSVVASLWGGGRPCCGTNQPERREFHSFACVGSSAYVCVCVINCVSSMASAFVLRVLCLVYKPLSPAVSQPPSLHTLTHTTSTILHREGPIIRC